MTAYPNLKLLPTGRPTDLAAETDGAIAPYGETIPKTGAYWVLRFPDGGYLVDVELEFISTPIKVPPFSPPWSATPHLRQATRYVSKEEAILARLNLTWPLKGPPLLSHSLTLVKVTKKKATEP